MKAKLITIVIVLLLSAMAFADPPNWVVMSGTQYNMIVMATIDFNGEPFTGEGDNIAAAFGPEVTAPAQYDTCRSIGAWLTAPTEFWYFTIVGNTNGEEISFWLYDSASDQIFPCYETVVFQDNITIGEPFDPFILTAGYQPYGFIAGTVTLIGGTGNVQNVLIEADGYTTNPDTSGYYFMELPIGIYDVTASLENYETQTIYGVEVFDSQTTIVDFVLNYIPQPGWIEGTVTLIGGLGNVEDVIVSANGVSTNPDANGYYSIELMPGIYNVTASLEGYIDSTIVDVEVIEGQVTSGIDFALESLYTQISGSLYGVLDLENSPYILVGDAYIEPENSLVIEPGVVIYSAGDYEFAINGTLIANGDVDNYITFNYLANAKGLTFNSINNSEFSYCKVINFSNQDRAAVSVHDDGLIIENCYFENCIGEDNGGAISVFDATIAIFDVVITNCIANQGNAIYIQNTQTPSETTVISEIKAINSSNNNIFYLENANVIFYHNLSNDVQTGSVIKSVYSSLNIVSCTFANIEQIFEVDELSTIDINSCILYPFTILANNVSPISIIYSDVQGGFTGQGNIDVDPMYYDNVNYYLALLSPCVDAGDPTLPYENEPLPNGNRINMGAYGNTEYATQTAVPVSGGTSGHWTPDTVYVVVNSINIPPDNTLIIDPDVDVYFDADVYFIVNGNLDAQGTEDNPIRFSGSDVHKRSKNRISEWQGIKFTETSQTDSITFTIVDNATNGIICEGSSPTLTNNRVSYSPSKDSTIALTLINSSAVVNNNIIEGYEYGIKIIGSDAKAASPTLTNNRVSYSPSKSTKSNSPIGIYVENADTNCVIDNNEINDYDTGIVMESASPTLTNNRVSYSPSKDGVIGMEFHNSNSDVAYNEIIDYAPAFYICEGSAPTLTNNRVSYSPSKQDIIGIYITGQSSAFIDRHTICKYDVGVKVDSSSSVDIVNTILWGNIQQDIIAINNSTANVTYSDIEDGYAGIGNISEDPLFVDFGNNDYHLTENSPCIDAGDPNSSPDPDGTRADIGAYYYHQLPVQWQIIVGAQYNMVIMTEVWQLPDSVEIVGDGDNILGAFGFDEFGEINENDCRGLGDWQDEGFWYLTILSMDGASEAIGFKIYDGITDSIFPCNEYVIFEPDATIGTPDTPFQLTVYTEPGAHQLISIDVVWNWISFNIQTEDTSIPAIFGTDGNIYQVKTRDNSATWYEDKWYGTLDSIEVGVGYTIKAVNPTYIHLTGTKAELTMPIELTSGWNWIGYLPQVPTPPEIALNSIEQNLIQVKAQFQSLTQYPVGSGHWYGDLIWMRPGYGYKLNMQTEDVLIYEIGKSNNVEEHIATDWKVISGTQYNMVVIAELEITNYELRMRNEELGIGVFDEEDNCRSIGKWEDYGDDGFWYFTIVGNEDNEELYFRAISNGISYESNETITFINDITIGNPEKPITITFSNSVMHIPKVYGLSQNYPNPFNPTTTIKYQLPEDTKVEITVYNILGQKVRTLVNEKKSAGYHSVIWDGKDDRNNTIGTGIYFYKISADNYSEIKKMLLMK